MTKANEPEGSGSERGKVSTPWQRGETAAATGLTAGDVAKAAAAKSGDSPSGEGPPSGTPTRAVPSIPPEGAGPGGPGSRPGPQSSGNQGPGQQGPAPKQPAPQGPPPKNAPPPKNPPPPKNSPPNSPPQSGPGPKAPGPQEAGSGPSGPPSGPTPPGTPQAGAPQVGPRPPGAPGPGRGGQPGPPAGSPPAGQAAAAVTTPVAGGTPAPGGARPGGDSARPDERPDLDAIHKTGAAAESPDRAAVRRIPASSSIGTPLRAAVQVRRVDPWSIFKVTGVLAVAGFLIWMIAIAVLYVILAGMGIWEQINSSFGTLVSADGTSTGGDLISSGQVFGFSALFGIFAAIVITALATILAYIYNVCADVVGGFEVTLADLD